MPVMPLVLEQLAEYFLQQRFGALGLIALFLIVTGNKEDRHACVVIGALVLTLLFVR